MTILNKSRDYTTIELYKLTRDPLATNLKAHVGEVLEVTGYVLREEEREDGTQEVLSLELAEGPAVSSNSPTVKRSFMDILDIYEESGNQNPFPLMIAVFSETARKSGREYINVRLVDAD